MAKLDIPPRQDGETEEEFRRRHCREKMRIYRARKPKSTRKRGKGKGPPSNGDMTREEWEALRQQSGESDEDYRKRYARAAVKRYRARNRDRLIEERRAAYAANPEPERERKRRLREEYPERHREYDRQYDQRNPGSRQARRKAWAEANPEKAREIAQRWRLANLDTCAFYASQRRAAELRAIPPWADVEAIQAFYAEARRLTEETGVPHHVDHIVPLRGRVVCGLHVETNLRVIPGAENVRKRNRLDYALIYSLHDCNPRGERHGPHLRAGHSTRLGRHGPGAPWGARDAARNGALQR